MLSVHYTEYVSPKQGPRAPDPRPARTRAAIIAAIERLGEQEADISVSLVVAEAGLSRSSFYSQFNDLGDVAVQLIQQLYDEPVPALVGHLDAGAPPEARFEATCALLEEFEKRRGLFAAVLGGGATVSAQWEVSEILARGVLRDITPIVPPDINAHVAARFIAAGYLMNIVEWVSDEHPAPIETMATDLLAMLPDWVAAPSGSPGSEVP